MNHGFLDPEGDRRADLEDRITAVLALIAIDALSPEARDAILATRKGDYSKVRALLREAERTDPL